MMKDNKALLKRYKEILKNLFYRFDRLKISMLENADDESKEDNYLKRLSRLQGAIKNTQSMIKELEKGSDNSHKSLGELANRS